MYSAPEVCNVSRLKICCHGRQWQHSEVWWPCLFSHHAAIQWDDYDKDYSDLPPQVSLFPSSDLILPTFNAFHLALHEWLLQDLAAHQA